MRMSDGKRKLSDWYVPPDIVVGMGLPIVAVTGILAAMFLPLLNQARNRGDATLAYIALLFGMIGIMLLFFARLPLYKQRKFFTFGSRALDAPHRKLYHWAYVFVGACVLLMISLL
jgi:hypothetical protein